MQHQVLRMACRVLLLTVPVLWGCASAPRTRVGLDTYLQNPEAYEGKKPLITATVADVLDRYELYRNKDIELTAPVTYFGDRRFWTWYLLLEQDQKKLRCYTHYYRVEAGWDALDLLRWARSQRGAVTVTGKLRRDGLELETMAYKGQFVRTSYKPPRFIYFYGWPYF